VQRLLFQCRRSLTVLGQVAALIFTFVAPNGRQTCEASSPLVVTFWNLNQRLPPARALRPIELFGPPRRKWSHRKSDSETKGDLERPFIAMENFFVVSF
jgi:hypothetical protein